MSKKITEKYINAAKWSAISEFLAKVIHPIVNMILARIISPEAFGVVATVSIVTSFSDMITDAGFQKFLIQTDFTNEELKHKFTNVSFWTNLGLSIIIWLVICIFNDVLATLVGNPGLGIVIVVAGFQVVLTAFTSIQFTILRREFQFKKIFILRMVGLAVPLFVTVPLALLNFSYWSIIIASLVTHVVNITILYTGKNWKPSFYYSFDTLKQ